MDAVDVSGTLNFTPDLLDVSYLMLWTVYDKAADGPHPNFKKPVHAYDSEITDDDILIRYEKRDVMGVTLINASRRGGMVRRDSRRPSEEISD